MGQLAEIQDNEDTFTVIVYDTSIFSKEEKWRKTYPKSAWKRVMHYLKTRNVEVKEADD